MVTDGGYGPTLVAFLATTAAAALAVVSRRGPGPGRFAGRCRRPQSLNDSRGLGVSVRPVCGRRLPAR